MVTLASLTELAHLPTRVDGRPLYVCLDCGRRFIGWMDPIVAHSKFGSHTVVWVGDLCGELYSDLDDADRMAVSAEKDPWS